MERKIRFSKNFKRKMALLAVATGLITAISMPLTFFVLTMLGEKEQANNHSQEVAQDVLNAIREEPEFWEYNLQKFLKVMSGYHNKAQATSDAEMSSIEIYGSGSSRCTSRRNWAKTSIVFSLPR